MYYTPLLSWFILVHKLPLIWPLGGPWTAYSVLWHVSLSLGALFTFWPNKMIQALLALPSSSPGISYFSKEPWLYFLFFSFFFWWGRLALFLFEEDCCWANICGSLPLFCMWDASSAWLDEWCVGSTPGIWTCEPWAAEAQPVNLTTKSPGQRPRLLFVKNAIQNPGSGHQAWSLLLQCPCFKCS